MVLRSALLAALALASACVTGQQAVRAPRPTPVAVAIVLDHEASRTVDEVPPALVERVVAELAERNLEARIISAETWGKSFAQSRTSAHRLSHLAANAGGADYVLLVETKAVFYSLLNGRYRWTVDARATLARRGALDDALVKQLEFAAYLDFDHQKEPQALTVAAPTIAERVGKLADDVLSAQATEPAKEAALPKARAVRKDDSIYFILVDRFHNGDRSNDGDVDLNDPAAFHGGDLQGVLDKLDYLQQLGVRTVWLSPVFKMRTEKFHGHGAFHGYWIEDLGEIEPRFGTKALLRKLSDELHRRDMRLLLDVVLNHVSYDAPLVKLQPEWFHEHGGIEDWNDRRQLETHDVHGLPDLAQENEAVYEYLLATSKKWIDEVKPDGFRLDAVKHIPLSFWARFNDDIRKHAGEDFFLLGEDLDGDPARLAKTLKEGKFTSVFDFPLHFAMLDVFCKGAPISRLATMLFADRSYDAPDRLVTLLDNHDLPRIATACGGDAAKVADATRFLLAVRGIPSFMYGTEAGLAGEKEPDNRADMPFGSGAALAREIRGGLEKRRTIPSDGEVIIRSGEDWLVWGSITTNSVTLVGVGELPETLSLGAPELEMAVMGLRMARRTGSRVAQMNVTPIRGDYAPVIEKLRAARTAKDVEFVVRGALPRTPGDTVYVIGSGPEFGAWDPARAIACTADGDALKASATLPGDGIYEFKLVIRKKDGSLVWEDRPNRLLVVPQLQGALEFSWNDRNRTNG